MPRISGLASSCASSVSSASRANRSAEPTIACGQPVRSCCAWTHSTSFERVAPAASWPARRPTARSRCGLGVGLVLVDRVVLPLQRLVGAEDARDHRPVEPRQPVGAARCGGGRRRSFTVASPVRASVGRSRAPARSSRSSWIAAMRARDRAVRRVGAPAASTTAAGSESRGQALDGVGHRRRVAALEPVARARSSARRAPGRRSAACRGTPAARGRCGCRRRRRRPTSETLASAASTSRVAQLPS